MDLTQGVTVNDNYKETKEIKLLHIVQCPGDGAGDNYKETPGYLVPGFWGTAFYLFFFFKVLFIHERHRGRDTDSLLS